MSLFYLVEWRAIIVYMDLNYFLLKIHHYHYYYYHCYWKEEVQGQTLKERLDQFFLWTEIPVNLCTMVSAKKSGFAYILSLRYFSKFLACPMCPTYLILWRALRAYVPDVPKILAFFLKPFCSHRDSFK